MDCVKRKSLRRPNNRRTSSVTRLPAWELHLHLSPLPELARCLVATDQKSTDSTFACPDQREFCRRVSRRSRVRLPLLPASSAEIHRHELECHPYQITSYYS